MRPYRVALSSSLMTWDAQHKRRCITTSHQASKKHNGFLSTPTLTTMLYSILLRAMLRTTRSPQGDRLIVVGNWGCHCATASN
jgi:hypothetical protein